MFNALKYIKNLQAVGFRREQAEEQVQLVLDAIGEEVATKGDISEVRSDFSQLRNEFSGLRNEFSGLRVEFAELKSDFAVLRGDFSELKSEIIMKLGTMIIGSVTAATAILGILIKT